MDDTKLIQDWTKELALSSETIHGFTYGDGRVKGSRLEPGVFVVFELLNSDSSKYNGPAQMLDALFLASSLDMAEVVLRERIRNITLIHRGITFATWQDPLRNTIYRAERRFLYTPCIRPDQES